MSTLPMDVAGNEPFDGEIQIESPDYTNYELLDPGYYISPSRNVVAEQRTDKNGKPFVMARLEMSELLTKDGTTIRLRKPIVKYIFSFPKRVKNHKGETSDVAQYLTKAGVQLGTTVRISEVKDAIGETAGIPVKVRVGWTNRTPQVNGEYLEERAYTNDFNRGAAGSPNFVPVISAAELATLQPKAQERLTPVVFEGVIRAKHRVEEFDRV